MTGLFYEIRNYFDQRFSGRYIALLLRELARHEPASFCKIIQFAGQSCHHDWLAMCTDIRNRRATVEHEYRFDGKTGPRRADLAVLREGSPILFVEIKEDDVRNPANVAQTIDYLKLQIPFIHLSRFPPEGADGRTIETALKSGRAVASIRYRDVHRVLRASDSPFAVMLCDYLEDIAVGTYRRIDMKTEERSLAFMLTQMLGFPHAQGLGRLHAKEAVSAFPQLLQRIFDDLEYVAEWTHQANRDSIRTRFLRGCRPYQFFSLNQLAKGIGKALEGGEVSNIDTLPGHPGKYVHEGYVYFYAYGRVQGASRARPKMRRQTDFLYVEVGFGFHIGRGAGRASSPARSTKNARIVRPFLYTSFYGNKLKEDDTSIKTNLTAFPNETIALKRFRKSLSRSRELAIKATADRGFKAALKDFRIPPLP